MEWVNVPRLTCFIKSVTEWLRDEVGTVVVQLTQRSTHGRLLAVQSTRSQMSGRGPRVISRRSWAPTERERASSQCPMLDAPAPDIADWSTHNQVGSRGATPRGEGPTWSRRKGSRDWSPLIQINPRMRWRISRPWIVRNNRFAYKWSVIVMLWFSFIYATPRRWSALLYSNSGNQVRCKCLLTSHWARGQRKYV